MDISTIVTWVILICAVLYIINIYNQLVTLKSRADNSFSQIEIQLKRRYDLIPNLIETAKGYLEHEKGTLEAVITARNSALGGLNQASTNPSDSTAIQSLGQAESQLTQALGKLNVVVEAYPELKANQTMSQLSEELASTENKVAFARQAFNDGVTSYNIYKKTFPPVLLATTFGHATDMSLLEFEDSQAIQAAPKVSF